MSETRKLATILVADVVGYSRISQHLSFGLDDKTERPIRPCGRLQIRTDKECARSRRRVYEPGPTLPHSRPPSIAALSINRRHAPFPDLRLRNIDAIMGRQSTAQ